MNVLIERMKAAYALQKNGDAVGAISEYDALLKILPGFQDILFFKATALDSLQRYSEALPLIEQAVKAKASDPNFAFHHAKILFGLNRLEEAKQVLHAVTQSRAGFAPAWYLLGCIADKEEQITEALNCYKQAILINPNDLPSRVGYAWVLHQSGGTKEALSILKEAVAIDGRHAAWHNSLGVMYKASQLLTEAEQCYARAIALDEKLFGAYQNLATLYTDQKRFGEAHAILDRAIALGDTGMSRYYKCMLHFLENNLDKALPMWGSRWGHADAKGTIHWPFAKWNGKPLKDKKLLIWGEQGIGDELMFASLLPECLKQNPNVVLLCQKRLVPLFSRSFACEILPQSAQTHKELLAREDIAAHCPIGDLLLYFKPDKSQPAHSGYLKADSERTGYFRKKYAALTGKAKIGISWHSSNYATGGARTIALSDWLPLLKMPDAHFISVQYGDFKQEVAAFTSAHQVPLFWDEEVDALKDMDALAAQVASLDMVISVANSTVHMAGGLGVPVWVMLPEVPSWRWGMNISNALWYPHIRLFRQERPFEWASTIGQIAAELHKSHS